MRNGLIVDDYGNKYWFEDNRLHREDGPAVEYADGYKKWHRDGKIHREDGPAVEHADGDKSWYFKDIWVGAGDKPDPDLWARLTSVEANGGPLLNGCIVGLDGAKYWYRDEKKHREDGPAVEWGDGNTTWFFHGEWLGFGDSGFWELWKLLSDEQRGNPNLLKWMPR